jgi:thioredoxin 1
MEDCLVSPVVRAEKPQTEKGRQKEDTMKGKTASLFTFMIVIAMVGLCSAGTVDDTLNNAVKQGKVVMLEIGSVGCVPCDKMRPVMEKLRTDYKDKLEVLFIDVRSDKDSPRRFGVTMIPTQVFLDKTGNEFHRHIGFYPYEEIAPILKKAGL